MERRKVNAYTNKGYPCRLITIDGTTMNVTEWREYIGCSWRTVFAYLNRGEEHFANYVRARCSYGVS